MIEINTKIYLVVLVLIGFACQNNDQTVNGRRGVKVFEKINLIYPNGFPDSSVSDEYHAVQVSDSYRWLENTTTPNAARWVGTQQTITEQYLSQISNRNRLKSAIEKYWNYERFSLPIKRGEAHYMHENTGLQQQDVVYRYHDILDDRSEVILDPNDFPEGVMLEDYKVSKDGTKIAYQVSNDASSWRQIRVKNLETGQMYPDLIEGVKFSCISWVENGFFYSRYRNIPEDRNQKDKFHQLYYHQLGTNQDDDEMVFADRHNPYSIIDAATTDDMRFLILKIKKNTLGNAFWFKKLDEPYGAFSILNDDYRYEFKLIDNFGDNLLIKTNYKAPRGRMILVNVNQPQEAYWQEVIPEGKEVLQTGELVNDRIVACYLRETYSVVKVYDLSGNFVGNLKMPEKGKVKCFEGERDENLAFFGFSTLTKPMSIYSVDVDQMKIRPFKTPKVAFPADGYKTRQVWFDSYDGTRIPMYLVHKEGLEIDGNRPTLMVVNGGLGQKLLPQFNPTGLNLLPYILEQNGVCAVVNVRGGLEMGKRWQTNGIGTKKQNAIRDFQAAAEYLISSGITAPSRLAVYGKENGAMIAGACMIKQPELFKVVIAEDGIFDMIRYNQYALGWAWQDEYGDVGKAENFQTLYGYSPVHNTERKRYPATMLISGTRNDVVAPMHTYKFLAGLQHAQQGDSPILLSSDEDGYAGYARYMSNKIDRASDVIAFLNYNFEENLSQ